MCCAAFFCSYWQCIASCCFGFVGTGSALCRVAWFLYVLAVHCVVLLGFVGTNSALCRAAWILLVLTVHCVAAWVLLVLEVHCVEMLVFVGTNSSLCRATCVLTVHFVVLLRFCWFWQCIMSCCLCFVGSDIALCRAAWVLLVMTVHCVVQVRFSFGLAVHCVVLHGFCWYWQCILSGCLGFVGYGSALCRADWFLLVMALHCVVLHGFC